MSAKWVRSRQWDDQHIPAWAWPFKAILRAFSSIPLAVCLLSLIVLYSTLASVPVGLMVLGLTYITYLLTLLACIGAISVIPVLIVRRLWRSGTGAARFIVTVAALIILTGAAIELWLLFLWPRLQYDPATGSGLGFFTTFIDQYRSTTIRRLPGVEMSEPEFYSWWPLRIILALFVLNMITATVRRIEFAFPNIGVLTVHTGIITIALGSMYYRGLKIEGDTLLLAGPPGPDGSANVGPIQDRFYDNMSTALWLNQNSAMWDQRPIQPPRYNDYGLKTAGWPTAKATVADLTFSTDGGRSLNSVVSLGSRQGRPVIDPDLRFHIVGYASYASVTNDWVKADAPATPDKPNPMRFIELRASIPDKPSGQSVFSFFITPDRPAHRISEVGGALALEWVRGMPESRWRALTEKLPPGATHAIAVEIPGPTPHREVVAISPDQTLTVGGYTIFVKELAPKPPFPIITEGYQGASSSIAILKITGPDGKSFDRWVYHRFPEITQDLSEELNERGMPRRRDADPAISITYIDASMIQIFLDEQADGSVRAAVRLPTGEIKIVEGLKTRSTIEEIVPRRNPDKEPKIDLVLGDRWDHSVSIERPQVVPEPQRDKSDIGTHTHSMLAVRITSEGQPWQKVTWLPFTRFHHIEEDRHREVELPDGRKIRMAFGRLAHRFPNFFLQLANFEMIAYDHRSSPRDYQSVVRVIPTHDADSAVAFKTYEHVTKLNEPLQAPFIWSTDRPYLANVWGTLRSRLDPRQFKLSQAGWDAEGWRKSQEMVDRGELKRPFASFTILGVGNNPGIHIIALGGVLMSLGIPWAFYIKPIILKHRKLKIQQAVAAGEYKKPSTRAEPVGANS